MKNKLFLFIILILILVSNIFSPIIEGNTNCYNEPKKNTAKAKEDCVNSTIYSNDLKTADVGAKLNELKKMSDSIKNKIFKNTKDIKQNKKDSKALANVAAGKDNDQSDACKKYPEACQ